MTEKQIKENERQIDLNRSTNEFLKEFIDSFYLGFINSGVLSETDFKLITNKFCEEYEIVGKDLFHLDCWRELLIVCKKDNINLHRGILYESSMITIRGYKFTKNETDK